MCFTSQRVLEYAVSPREFDLSLNLNVPFEPTCFSLDIGCHLFSLEKSTFWCRCRLPGRRQGWAWLEAITAGDPTGGGGAGQSRPDRLAAVTKGSSDGRSFLMFWSGDSLSLKKDFVLPFNCHIIRSCFYFLHMSSLGVLSVLFWALPEIWGI